MNKTSIEWVKNPDGTQGYTWNPITGCLNGCPYCYARKLANERLKARYLDNKQIARPSLTGQLSQDIIDSALKDPFYPRFWPERLDDPFITDRNILIKRHTWGQRRTPRGIFVCDMGELFGDWVPREWQDEIWMCIICNPQHRFYLLTKQPQNLIKFSPFPENCWVGVTVTNYKQWCDAIPNLMNVQATVKFISFEPLLESLRFTENNKLRTAHYPLFTGGINWVIIGVQTKPTVYPKIEWAEEIARACDRAGVKVFLKNNLRPLLVDALAKKLIDHKQFFVHSIGHGGDLRQEMPNG